jgi:hypothetical protein
MKTSFREKLLSQVFLRWFNLYDTFDLLGQMLFAVAE